MKTGILIFFLLACSSLFSQSPGPISFPQVGWTITLPEGFTIDTKGHNNERMQRGVDMIEEVNDLKVDMSGLVTLIAASRNTYNMFNATLEAFDPKKDGNWDSTNNLVKAVITRTFQEKMRDVTIDTSSSEVMLDGLRFDKFSIRVKASNRTVFYSGLLSKLYKGYSFGISYVVLDDKILRQVEDMLSHSTFKK